MKKYRVVITCSAGTDLSYEFIVQGEEDFPKGLQEAIGEWKRHNPGETIISAGCTVRLEGPLDA